MAAHLPDDYQQLIRSGTIAPVVLFTGEEELLAEECIDQLVEASVDASLREFNLDVLDGSRTEVQDVLARATSFPMMSERRVVLVRNADKLLSTERARELLSAYVDRPSATTRLILVADKADLRKRPFTQIRKSYDIVDCRPLPERHVAGWIQARARRLGKTIDPESAVLLQSYTGSGLFALLRELEKLATYVGDRKEITRDDVTTAVGATRGYTIFELQDAVGHRDYAACATILRRMMTLGDQSVMLVANLSRYFMQLHSVRECLARRLPPPEIASRLGIHPYRAKLLGEVASKYSSDEIVRAIHLFRETDRRLKSTPADPGAELDILLHTIVRGTHG